MPKVFLSSTFQEEGGENPLRQDFASIGDGRCWDYNTVYSGQPHACYSAEPHAFRDLLRCIEGVRACESVAILVCKRHGSGIAFGADGRGSPGGPLSRVSFFEAEIFAAAALRKPVFLFMDPALKPDDGLASALSVLVSPNSGAVIITGTRSELAAHWSDLLEGRLVAREPLNLPALVDFWARRRTRAHRAEEVHDPRLGFIDVWSFGGTGDPESATRQLAALRNPPVMAERELSHLGKLVILWSAWRDLAPDGRGLERDPVVRRLAQEILGLWTISASWLGLHSHIDLSPWAAANEQRAFAHDSPNLWRELSVRHPDHARASTLYSIAQNACRPRDLYLTAIDIVTSMRRTGEAFENARSVRAKAAMRLAALNLKRDGWRLGDALQDLHKAVAWRKRQSADAFGYGDALVELGLCEAKASKGYMGVERIIEGLAIMTDASGARPTVEQQGFLARAHKTLALSAVRRKHADLREESLAAARRYADLSGSLDQLRLL